MPAQKRALSGETAVESVKRPRLAFHFPTADKVLAVWLRGLTASERERAGLGSSARAGQTRLGPRSQLHLAGESTAGREQLECHLASLQYQRQQFSTSPEYHHVLASVQDRLGRLDQARSSIHRCLQLVSIDPAALQQLPLTQYLDRLDTLTELDRSALWLEAKLELALTIRETKAAGAQELKLTGSGGRQLEVAVREYSSLSPTQFEDQCRAGQPLLLTNVPRPTSADWTEQHLVSVAGECGVEAGLRCPAPASTEWAGLETTFATPTTLAQFLKAKAGRYLFDWSLPLHCPALAAEFTVPTLLGPNLLEQTAAGALYRHSWPSLFIAPKQTNRSRVPPRT